MTKDEIRKEIKAALQRKGWSESDLSRASKISRPAIHRFLQSRDDVSPPVLYRLRKALSLDKPS